MAGNIKGITIEFNGDTTQLDKALRQINKETRDIDKELKQVDKALKFNPTNVELWRQKQQLLTQKVDETKQKLNALKQAQAKMDAEGVDKNSAEYRKLQREIIVTENQVKNFEGQLRKVGNVNLRAASEQVRDMGNKLTSAGEAMKGISTAAAGVVASLGAVAYKAGTAADDLNTMSKVTGIGTDELQKYSYAADLVDVSTEAVAKANKKLAKNAYSAANGSKSQTAAFEKLGVAVVDDNGNLRDSEAIFQDTIAALGSMENETERTALAQKLMGGTAAELNPLIADGGETYKMVADTMAKYNLDYVDQETLDKANQFNDELDTMKLLGSVAIAQVGSELAANLAPALEKVVDLVGRFAEWLGNLDPKVLTVIGTIAAVVAAIAPVLIVLGKLAFAVSSIMSLMATIGPAIGAFVTGPLLPIVAIIAGVIAIGVLLYKNWDKIKAKAKELGKNIKKAFDDIKKNITKTWNTIKQFIFMVIRTIYMTVTKIFTNLKTTITNIWNGIKSGISTVILAIKTVIVTVFNAVKTFITAVVLAYKHVILTVWNAIKTGIAAVVKGIKTVISTVFNAIKTFLSNVVKGWKIILTTAWNAIKDVATKVWNGIKSAVVDPIKSAKDKVADIVSSIKSKVSGAFDGIASKVKGAFNKVKEAIQAPLDKAKNIVHDAIGKIKGMFPLKLGKIFSGIKLPHFKISGGKIPWGIGGKGTAPKVDVEWYAKGGIFNSPSVIGVGEAGSEAVVPLDKFWNKLDNMSAGDTTINIVINGAGDPRAVADEVKRMLIRETNQRRLAWQ